MRASSLFEPSIQLRVCKYPKQKSTRYAVGVDWVVP